MGCSSVARTYPLGKMGRDFRRREDEENAFGFVPDSWPWLNSLSRTEGDRLRHSKFVALRDDKNPRDVVKEQSGEG